MNHVVSQFPIHSLAWDKQQGKFVSLGLHVWQRARPSYGENMLLFLEREREREKKIPVHLLRTVVLNLVKTLFHCNIDLLKKKSSKINHTVEHGQSFGNPNGKWLNSVDSQSIFAAVDE